MVLVVATHSVTDYERWKRHFDDGIGRRRELGVRRHWVCRSVDDGDEVMVTMEMGSREAAEGLLRAGDVQEWMDRTGVDIYPAVMVAQEVERIDY